MPEISIILSCYNTGKYLEQSIDSVREQEFSHWELIIVNDGSTDDSLAIAERYARTDARISVQSKQNGGLASARLHGLNFISPDSRYLLFYDADDKMDPRMLSTLFNSMEADAGVGAAYCNHRMISPENVDLGLPTFGTRVVPTTFWVKKLEDKNRVTPFISIFCWATRMIEPMTLIRREAYEKSSGWDPHLGGRGNIGEGVLLFSEIALTWKVLYIDEPLYLYRKHSQQATAGNNQDAGEKLLSIWQENIRKDKTFAKDIKAAIICYRTRMVAFYKMGSLKHTLKHAPHKAISLAVVICYKYIQSLQLLFYKRTKIFQ